jgi:hypothetical protein
MGTKKRTKTTEITVERSEVVVVLRAKKTVYARCEACGARMRMLTPEEASEAAGVSTRTIYRGAEAGKVHFTETAEGKLFVCLSSLLKWR